MSVLANLAKYPKMLYLVIMLSAIGGFLFGYDTGVIAGALPLVEKTDGFFPSDPKQADDWESGITAATVGAAFIFSFVGGFVTNRWGRKPAILTAAVVFTIGAIIMGAANQKEVLLVGRIVLGMGIGMASMCVPVYMAETSPEDIRGFLGASFQVMITFGQVTSALVDALFANVSDGWRYDFGLAAVPGVILLVGFIFCPESPRYLVQKGRIDHARAVLKKLRSASCNIEEELQEIIKVCKEDEKIAAEGGNSWSRMSRTPSVRKALIIGVTLQLFQQLAGINTVIYYSARILQMSGISNKVSTILWISCGVNAINFFASFIGLYLVDRVGRRLLTLVSYGGILISLLMLAIGFTLAETNSPAVADQYVNATSSGCSQFSSCSSCTWDYDYIQGTKDPLNCGFCYTKGEDGPQNGRCIPWERDENNNEMVPSNPAECDTNNTDSKFVAQYCPTQYSPMVLIGLCLYLVSFQSGLGPVPWIVNAEIYPLWFRSQGVSLSTSFNWALNLTVSETFLYLIQVLRYGTWYLYAGCSFVAIIFFSFTLPETKGKSLEDMDALFSNSFWRLGKAK